MASSAVVVSLATRQVDSAPRGQSQITCQGCALKQICLPTGLNDKESQLLENAIRRRHIYREGEHIFRQGGDFHSLFVVRSGAVKTYTVTEQGEEQVTGFYLPGEMIGLDGIYNSQHMNSAVVLESSSICEVSFSQLENLHSVIPSLQHMMFRLMSREIQADQQMLLVLTKKSAEARLATLLLNISNRLALLCRSDSQFSLPMCRADTANFLGMAVETVCREFTRLNKLGVIKVCRRQIEILDKQKLATIAGISMPVQVAPRMVN